MTTLLNRYSSERAKFRKVARELSEAPPRVRVADGGAEERGDREDELLKVQGQTGHEKFIRNGLNIIYSLFQLSSIGFCRNTVQLCH